MACSVVRFRVDDGLLLAKKPKRNTAGLPPIQHAVGAAAIRLKQDKTNSRLTNAFPSYRAAFAVGQFPN
jgi:hypothetical protein